MQYLTIYMGDVMKIVEENFHENIQLVSHFILYAVLFLAILSSTYLHSNVICVLRKHIM